MTARSMHRGWPMEYVGDTWVYSDTKLPVAADPMRKCGHCFLPERPDGHDPCLGKLPGAKNACCGHGDPRAAYVQFLDGRVLSGQEALEAMCGDARNTKPPRPVKGGGGRKERK